MDATVTASPPIPPANWEKSVQKRIRQVIHMKEEYAQLDIATEKLEAFVICLALGTLREMRDGNISYEAGIWTLGRPIFNRIPEIERLLSKKTLKVIHSADEVDVLATLAGVEEANKMLDKMIDTLQKTLKSLDDPCWYAKWRIKNQTRKRTEQSGPSGRSTAAKP